jgi:transposase InsO family protein
MMDFIEESRETLGVEPICKALQFAPSTYYERRAIARDPERASLRAKSDAALSLKIDGAWADNRKLYGARKIWHVLRRDGEVVARCTVERLMRRLGIKGVVRGRRVITTNPDTSQPCPDDKVNRLFKADRPNKLWGRSLWRHWSEPNGRRLYLCAHMVRNGLRCLRDRRLCKADRRLANLDIHEDTVCARRAGAGYLAKKNAR